MKLTLALFSTCALMVSLPSQAANLSGGITENAVRDFSNEMNEAHNKPYDQYTALVDSAFTEDSTFEIQDKLTIPGQPVKETSQNLSKSQYMGDLKSGYDILQGAKVRYKINEIKIAPDKQSAVLKDETFVQNKVPAPGSTGNKIQNMDFTSTAKCETDLVLTPDKRLQAQKTICDSQTNVVLPAGMIDQ